MPAVWVYVTEQVAVAVEPLNEQLAAGLKLLVPTLLEKLTVPVGVMNVPPEVSVTVAVHVVPWLIATVEGEQETEKVTVRCVTVITTGELRLLA